MGKGRARQKNVSSNMSGGAGGGGGASASDSLFMSEDEYLDTFDFEILDKLEEQDVESFEDMVWHYEYNALPQVLSADKFDKLIEQGEVMQLARGITATDEAHMNFYLDSLKEGIFHVAGGQAYFGQGMYTFSGDSLNQAQRYAGGAGGVVRLALQKDAKILTVDVGKRIPMEGALGKYANMIENPTLGGVNSAAFKFLESKGVNTKPIKALEPSTDLIFKDYYQYDKQKNKYENMIKKEVRTHLKKELSKDDYRQVVAMTKNYGSTTMAMARGYDAVRLTKEYVNESSSNGKVEITIVLNRGKLIVSE